MLLLVTGPDDTMKTKLEVAHHEKTHKKPYETEVPPMSRGPRPHRALAEAIPIAKARGIIQLALGGPERVFDIAIISKLPVTFVRIMFAPEILATIQQFADNFKEEIAQLRVIARDAAITAELWLRSKHGTWRFFLVTPSTLVEIDREGKRLLSGQSVAYGTGNLVSEGGISLS
jgi:hypothetical protein